MVLYYRYCDCARTVPPGPDEKEVYYCHHHVAGDDQTAGGAGSGRGLPGGVPYTHRCFVVFRNALITFYGEATAAAEHTGERGNG